MAVVVAQAGRFRLLPAVAVEAVVRLGLEVQEVALRPALLVRETALQAAVAVMGTTLAQAA